ncbi:MAG: hypothetical protein U0694_02780 [Anaerolineae bacterium]
MDDLSSVWTWLRVGGLWLQATIIGGFFTIILIMAIFVRVRPAKLFGLSAGYFMFTFVIFLLLRLTIAEPSHSEIFTMALIVSLPLVFIGNALFEYGYRKTIGAPTFDPHYEGLSFSEKKRRRDKGK